MKEIESSKHSVARLMELYFALRHPFIGSLQICGLC